MKKEIIIILILLATLPITLAQQTPDVNDAPLVKEIQEGQKKVQEISEIEDKEEYLKNEWTKVLEKSAIGKIIIKTSDFIKIFNPLIKLILGVEYSLSTAFIFALIIWAGLFLLLIHPLRALLNSLPLGILGAFITASIIGISGVIKKAVDLLSLAITNLWLALISIVIAVIIALGMEILGKKLKKKIENAKEESAKAKTEQDRKIIGTDAKIAKKDLESR